MAAPEEETSAKRMPESASALDLQPEEEEIVRKRLPEYSSREEEAIGEDFLTGNVGAPEAEAVSGSNGIEELRAGTALLKYPRRTQGVPHFKFVQLANDNTYLRWFSKKKKSHQSTIQIADIQQVLKGQQTEVFRKSQQPQLEVASFSIIYGADALSFDVVAKGQDECTLWFETITALVDAHKDGEDITQIEEFPSSITYVDRYRCDHRDLLTAIVGDEQLPRPVVKALLGEVKKARSKYGKIQKLLNSKNYDTHRDCAGLAEYAAELCQRIEMSQEFCSISTSDKISRSDVWRLNVDMDAILEKCEVCAKEL